MRPLSHVYLRTSFWRCTYTLFYIASFSLFLNACDADRESADKPDNNAPVAHASPSNDDQAQNSEQARDQSIEGRKADSQPSSQPEQHSELQNLPVAITPQIAIVIDDLGYSLEHGLALAAIPYPMTFAVIPGSPHARRVTELAIDAEQELILHVPMQPKNLTHWEDGLNVTQSKSELSTQLNMMLDNFPEMRGINNHGGSLLTSDRERMNWVMQVLAKRNLFFLDSRTTSDSQAVFAANAHHVRNLERDVFLDNVLEQAEIDAAFDKLRRIARKHGRAIAIGHPHALTIERLAEQLPLLVAEGFELSFCSDLIDDAIDYAAQ